jgi:hypothetical protein
MRTAEEVLAEVVAILSNGMPRDKSNIEDAVGLARDAIKNAPRRADRWQRLTNALDAYAYRQRKLVDAVRADVSEHKNQGIFEDYMMTKHFPRTSKVLHEIAKVQIEREERNAKPGTKSS